MKITFTYVAWHLLSSILVKPSYSTHHEYYRHVQKDYPLHVLAAANLDVSLNPNVIVKEIFRVHRCPEGMILKGSSCIGDEIVPPSFKCPPFAVPDRDKCLQFYTPIHRCPDGSKFEGSFGCVATDVVPAEHLCESPTDWYDVEQNICRSMVSTPNKNHQIECPGGYSFDTVTGQCSYLYRVQLACSGNGKLNTVAGDCEEQTTIPAKKLCPLGWSLADDAAMCENVARLGEDELCPTPYEYSAVLGLCIMAVEPVKYRGSAEMTHGDYFCPEDFELTEGTQCKKKVAAIASCPSDSELSNQASESICTKVTYTDALKACPTDFRLDRGRCRRLVPIFSIDELQKVVDPDDTSQRRQESSDERPQSLLKAWKLPLLLAKDERLRLSKGSSADGNAPQPAPTILNITIHNRIEVKDEAEYLSDQIHGKDLNMSVQTITTREGSANVPTLRTVVSCPRNTDLPTSTTPSSPAGERTSGTTTTTSSPSNETTSGTIGNGASTAYTAQQRSEPFIRETPKPEPPVETTQASSIGDITNALPLNAATPNESSPSFITALQQLLLASLSSRRELEEYPLLKRFDEVAPFSSDNLSEPLRLICGGEYGPFCSQEVETPPQHFCPEESQLTGAPPRCESRRVTAPEFTCPEGSLPDDGLLSCTILLPARPRAVTEQASSCPSGSQRVSELMASLQTAHDGSERAEGNARLREMGLCVDTVKPRESRIQRVEPTLTCEAGAVLSTQETPTCILIRRSEPSESCNDGSILVKQAGQDSTCVDFAEPISKDFHSSDITLPTSIPKLVCNPPFILEGSECIRVRSLPPLPAACEQGGELDPISGRCVKVQRPVTMQCPEGSHFSSKGCSRSVVIPAVVSSLFPREVL